MAISFQLINPRVQFQHKVEDDQKDFSSEALLGKLPSRDSTYEQRYDLEIR